MFVYSSCFEDAVDKDGALKELEMLGFINRAARYYGGEGIFKSPEGRRVLGLMALGLFATAGLWGMPFAGPAGDSLDWLSRQLGPSLGLSPIQTRVFLRDTLKEVFKEVPSLGFMGILLPVYFRVSSSPVARWSWARDRT